MIMGLSGGDNSDGGGAVLISVPACDTCDSDASWCEKMIMQRWGSLPALVGYNNPTPIR